MKKKENNLKAKKDKSFGTLFQAYFPFRKSSALIARERERKVAFERTETMTAKNITPKPKNM